MARRRSDVLLRVTGNSSDARKAVADAREDVRRFGRETAQAKLTVQIEGVREQVARAEANVERWRAQLEANPLEPKVKIALARAEATLTRFQLRLNRLENRSVNIDVDVRRGAIERGTAALGSMERGFAGVTRGAGNMLRAIPIVGQFVAAAAEGFLKLGSAIGGLVTTGLGSLFQLVGIFPRLGSSIAGLAGAGVSLVASFAGVAAVAGGLVVALNAVLGAIVALGAALVALAASLGAAVAGMGALGVGLAGALGPAVLVLIGLFQRFHAILEARQAREQALASATEDQKNAEERRVNALEQSRAAHERLAETVVAARKAMAQAAEDQSDAELGLESSRLGVQEARLSLREAQASLKEFIRTAGVAGPTLNGLTKKFSDVNFDPSEAGRALGAAGGRTSDPNELQRRILAVARAKLGIKQANDQVSDSERTLREATAKNADFARRGTAAYAPLRAAKLQVARADRALTKAEDDTSAASRKYHRALQKLSGTERGTLDRLNRLIDGFKKLAKAFTDPIFASLNSVFDSLQGKGFGLESALTAIGTAMGGAVRSFGAFLREPRTISAFKEMASGAAELTRQLTGRAFIDFLRIMREVATAAMPTLVSGAKSLADWLAKIAARPGQIQQKVQGLISQFKTWGGVAKELTGLIYDIFKNAAPEGKSLAESIRQVLSRWRRFVQENPEKVREFFRNAVKRTRELWHNLRDAYHWLKQKLPAAADTATKAFRVMKSIVDAIADTIRFILDTEDKFFASPVGGGREQNKISREDVAAARKDISLLQTHLSPQERENTRDRLRETLLDLKSLHRLPKEWEPILKRLQNIFNADGGGGNFKASGASLKAGISRHLNPLAGVAVAAAPVVVGGGASPSVTVNNHFNVPSGRSPDERSAAGAFEREIRLALAG